MQDISKPSILIVDDEKVLLRSIKRNLSNNYNVYTATNYEEGIELLKYNPQVAIIDYSFPDGTDGVTIAKKVKEILPLCYIIMLSGVREFNILKDILNTRVIDLFINKPININKLNEAIESGINQINEKNRLSSIISETSNMNHIHSILINIVNNKTYSEPELVGLIISSGGLPIYSKFSKNIFNVPPKDSIITALIDALTSMEQLIFENNLGMQSVIVSGLGIYFKSFHNYLIIYLYRGVNNVDDDKIINEQEEIEKILGDNMEFNNLKKNKGYVIRKDTFFERLIGHFIAE